ncbi:hypothetical protein A2574_01725 [Candidatus Shapirobacteria bacterium RIFOXYD1_FULL_38_32]|uniref:SH3b domain-containing protein n=1 Tax=Candidatus Shapirobacteria bacterium GW2011_GWE2_38_30 TaxID=1618490 RepID=A0A0G0N3K2_9BACT|nr:MAG: hypothetical protein US90_C0001G0001 [Candidatus Shapirobacteria bacterium GW2011_GWE2_38_30]OGL57072.1 MAG: hypothetical protein A2410_00375 [Candidatus Shapirobacteria bacterium RIFOXYC1_FULL_38_24]OGL57737.1 MAG: hypothetical protein A2574_01725 [Candidatus Shapirobacteria bacterium RIFOXYD1_FULL_38_32]HAP37725.1 hypothetical protein [Candidatus Shapirobacteria bacterium]HCU55575.1 hypothetical protein [Candidatus Shapirobacteria bacterium]
MKTVTKYCKWLKILLAGIFFLVPAFPVSAAPGEYQQCTNTADCIVGEFLFNDEYVPVADADCTLTARYPDGTVFINSATLPPSADGWYSYDIGTSGQPLGLYRSQICCTTIDGYMCLDKSFTITQDTAESVWSYDNRTISSFGNIVQEIWTYSDRSLSGFGTLVSDIWGHTSKTLSSPTLDNGATLATTDTVNSVGTSLSDISLQLTSVQNDLVTIDSKVDSLQTSVTTIQTNTDNILAKWSTYSVTDILNYIDSLESELGNNTQTCTDDSVFGQVQCLIDKWGTNSASTIYNAANGAYTTATALRSELNFNGKSTTAYDEIITLKAYVDSIENSIGSTSDTSNTASIFGRIQQVKEAIEAIDNSTLDLNDLLEKWGSLSATDIYDKVKDLSTDIAAINSVSNVENITNNNITQNTDLSELMNQVLAMKALLSTNRTLLETVVSKPIITSWLEEGSIIFKSLITNPSKTSTQTVPYLYYFPSEVKQENIIKKSPELEIKFDATKSVYYASADITLKPGGTIILEVQVEDIWTIPQEKIDSLKKQADELFAPLKNTSYFAQGTTLHSNILASLDKITILQKQAKLPEDKIIGYYETKIELDSVNRNLESLKTIVSSAGSIGTLSGFIGGVQAISVWGIIIVLVAGFAFLAIYIRSLTPPKPTPPSLITPPVYSTSQAPPSQPQDNGIPPPTKPRASPKIHRGITIAAIVGLSFGLSSSVTYQIFQSRPQKSAILPSVLSATTDATPTPSQKTEPSPTKPPQEPTNTPQITPTQTPTPTLSILKKVIIAPTNGNKINLRSQPDSNSVLITTIPSGIEIPIYSEKYNDLGEKWLQTSYDSTQGWILSLLVQEIQSPAPSSSSAPLSKINIRVPSYDTVYLYSKPSFNSSVTHKLTQDQTAEILVETKRWVKVILTRINVEGWISQDFIERNLP